jgi:hypothetical protein
MYYFDLRWRQQTRIIYFGRIGGSMNVKKQLRNIVAGSVISAGIVAGAQVPAFAAWPSDQYGIAGAVHYNDYSEGVIRWSNRSAVVDGYVQDDTADNSSSQVIFEAFAGATKIDTDNRTANRDSSLGAFRDFTLTIGDPDLVGGIDRIKITVRHTYSNGTYVNGPTFQVHRDGSSENVGNL